MLRVTLGLDSPNQSLLVTKDEVSPKILALPLLRIFFPEPDLVNFGRPAWIVLQEPLAEDLKWLAFPLLAKVLFQRCNELIECSQRNAPVCTQSD